MYDIITIGSATRDVFLISEQFIALKTNRVSTGVAECMALGSKVEIKDIIFTTGGGATNAAATFASLGFRTATITRVGKDNPGKDIIEDLSQHGVSTHLVKAAGSGATAYSTLITMEDGERTALVYRGTCGAFRATDIPQATFKQTKWIYLTSLGGNDALPKKIITSAHKAGVRVAWNPGHEEIKNGFGALKDVLPFVDVLIMNTEDVELLTGKKKIPQMLKMIAASNTVRIITDGTNGSYVEQGGKIFHARTTGVKAISRTGAGDAFGSGFVASFIKDTNAINALAIGTINAESVIRHIGAKLGILKSWPTKRMMDKIKID